MQADDLSHTRRNERRRRLRRGLARARGTCRSRPLFLTTRALRRLATYSRRRLSASHFLEKRDVRKVLRTPCGSLVRYEVIECENRDREVTERRAYHSRQRRIDVVDSVGASKDVDANWRDAEIDDLRGSELLDGSNHVRRGSELLERSAHPLEVVAGGRNEQIEILRRPRFRVMADGVPADDGV